MKLHSSVGPNPRVVRMFMLERGVELDAIDVDIIGGENLGDDYRKLNPAAQSPCLELDSGLVISEITAVCAYLDEITDGPSLIGETPEERAEARMWMRRFDAKILEPLSLAFRSAEALGLFENRCYVIPHAADDLKATVQENWAWIDTQMAGKDYVCGDRFTLADIQLYVFADFGSTVGQGIPASCANLQAWFARIGARDSAPNSFHPAELAQAG